MERMLYYIRNGVSAVKPPIELHIYAGLLKVVILTGHIMVLFRLPSV